MYPVHDNDRRNGSNCPVLMISSEHWTFTKYQAAFRKDFKQNTIKKIISKLTNQNLIKNQNDDSNDNSEYNKDKNDYTNINHNYNKYHDNEHHSFYHPFSVTILGSDHLNYCDMVYLTSPILMTRDNYLGSTNPYKLSLAKDYLILHFFVASSLIQSSSINSNSNKIKLNPIHSTQPDLSSVDEISSSSPLSVSENEITDVERLFRYCHISSHHSPLNNNSNSNNNNSDNSDNNDYDWSTIEPIPQSIHDYLVDNLVDESSLPHCFDHEVYDRITQDRI